MGVCASVTTATGLKRRWFGNSVINLIGGGGTAAVNVLLPAVVAKYLSTDSFSLWSLALQIVAYVNLLALGLQTATARAVSFAGDGGAEGRAQWPVIARAARSIGRVSSAVALIMIAALVVAYPVLFPSVPPSLIGEFRVVLVLFGLAAMAQILAQADMGIFQGLHRYSVFVGGKLITRVGAVFLVWVGVRAHQPVTVLALLMTIAMFLLWPAMRLALRRSVPWALSISSTLADKACRWELLQYCGAFSVMSVSMLVVESAGVLIVGRLDFHMTGAYAIAMTAATVPVGLLGAALSPLLTSASAMYAQVHTRARLPGLLIRSTIVVAIGLNLFFALILVLHPEIVRLWVGEKFVATAGPLVVILIGAHCLRNICAPYSLMMLAAGLHRRALATAALEGLANLVASILLGFLYGAIGVAWGVFIGSVVGVAGSLIINTSRTPEITPRPFKFSLVAVALPIVVFLPLQLFLWHLTM